MSAILPPSFLPEKWVYRSHARCAHTYDLAISSFALRLLMRVCDCARREVARSSSFEGIGPAREGRRLWRFGSRDLFIVIVVRMDDCW